MNVTTEDLILDFKLFISSVSVSGFQKYPVCLMEKAFTDPDDLDPKNSPKA